MLQNFLIERTPKAAFQALNLSIKYSRPFPSDLKTDQEVLKASKVIFLNFKNTHNSPSSSSSCFACLEFTESRYQHYKHMACF